MNSTIEAVFLRDTNATFNEEGLIMDVQNFNHPIARPQIDQGKRWLKGKVAMRITSKRSGIVSQPTTSLFLSGHAVLSQELLCWRSVFKLSSSWGNSYNNYTYKNHMIRAMVSG